MTARGWKPLKVEKKTENRWIDVVGTHLTVPVQIHGIQVSIQLYRCQTKQPMICHHYNSLFLSFFFFLPQHISSERNDFHQPTKLTHINAKEYDNGNDVQHSPQQQHNDCISVFVSTTTSSQAKNDDCKLEGQQLKRLKQRF